MSELTIDLKALKANYTLIKKRVSGSCDVAGVVKANAYGCGVSAVAQALKDAGCKTFFVATLPEALELRLCIGDEPRIMMLNGFDEQDAKLYQESRIIPVLNHESELKLYADFARKAAQTLPAMLHIDTGMNRLGFDATKIHTKGHNKETFAGIDLQGVMTHFTSAEDIASPKSAAQADSFTALCDEHFPNVPQSLCNSSGIFRESSWHRDLVRPGMALYGLNPTPQETNPMRPVVSLNAKILQIREAKKGEKAGYNETYRFDKNEALAVVSMGYADGFLRELSNKAALYWQGIACPVRGRVSMDSTIVDISAVPEGQRPVPGDSLEVIGPGQSADDLAHAAGTIGYEILTSLGSRYKRTYIF